MAARAISVTLQAAANDGKFHALSKSIADPTVTAAAIADATALSAAMAVLVADAALPTQAHVTTANNALTSFLAAKLVYETAVQASVSADGVFIWNTTTVNTSNKVWSCISHVLQMLRNLGSLLQ